jgi:hypothetical protein
MPAIIKIKSEDLNPAFIHDLQEQYGSKAELEIRVQPEAAEILSEDAFWRIIELLDWSKEGDDAAVIEPVIATLAELPISFIYQFADKFSEKLYHLDTKAHATAYNKEADEFISVDDFLYVRVCVVANGRAFYEDILSNPSKMFDLSFEPLLYVAWDAYKRKTSKEWDYIPAYNFETFSNKAGWQ